MISAKTLAEYLIYLNYEIQGQDADITPMKLQKLLYYCQGYSLALTGKPIFYEEIEAWKNGPVVESVYQEYKKYKNNVISISEPLTTKVASFEKIKILVQEVCF